MGGLSEQAEVKLERFLDAGGVINVRENKFTHGITGREVTHVIVWCHINKAEQQLAGARMTHWKGEDLSLPDAIASAMYWVT